MIAKRPKSSFRYLAALLTANTAKEIVDTNKSVLLMQHTTMEGGLGTYPFSLLKKPILMGTVALCKVALSDSPETMGAI